jgi:hypothetical protein
MLKNHYALKAQSIPIPGQHPENFYAFSALKNFEIFAVI